MSLLEETLRLVPAVDRSIETRVRARLDDLTKPPGSLGRLEELALQYCLATGTASPVLGKKRIVTFAGDHGVAARGVSAFPSSVTPQMVMNMLGGGAAVNVLGRHAGAEVVVVDVGVDHDFEGAPGLVSRKVRRATRDMTEGPAMT
ncbi:MAG: nicotinate-nucleotide--dimethylbenzimidazole phosphoribosyltransferase, partial [Deltaproteobacteria bacterium]|nr:nicotinate-nucleotide--dimethylbenzimidazole phosphoribosyltransferase [Deltaproteobacteria bacterium]